MNDPIVAAVGGHRYWFANEFELHEGVAGVLTDAGIVFEREVVLSPRDRIDFLAGSTGIEVKVKGSAPLVLAQLIRYAHSDVIDRLVLVTNRNAHRRISTAAGVPVDVIYVGGM